MFLGRLFASVSGVGAMSALSFNQDFAPKTARPLSVVVLDDDRFDRKRIMRWVKAVNGTSVELHEASDLGKFEQVLAHHSPDMIILDYQLADGDGVDAMEIYANSCGNPAAYIVMVSGCDAPDRKQRALECGCDRFIEKSALSGDSISQFMTELRGGATIEETVPHAKLGATEYWVARARRRTPHPSLSVAPIRPKVPMTPTDDRLFLHEPAVWASDWPGAAAFFRDFLTHDELEFIKRSPILKKF